MNYNKYDEAPYDIQIPFVLAFVAFNLNDFFSRPPCRDADTTKLF